MIRRALPAVLFVSGIAVLAEIFLPTGWAPLFGSGDTEVIEHEAYLLASMIHFLPFPHLTINTDVVFYPYGIPAVFIAWVLERDYLFLLLTACFGRGPWMQLYSVASFAIAGVGAYCLLRRPVGGVRAMFAAFAVSFLSFYALLKYPGHHNLVEVHWMVLALVVDFLAYREVVREGRLRLSTVELRLLLTLLSLGLDLSYVAGLSLTSLTVTGAFCAWALRHGYREQLRSWRSEFSASPGKHVAMLGASAVVAWLYVPFVLQVFLESRKYPSASASGWYWPNPVRFLVPWFPFFSVPSAIGDRPESIADYRPGWALLVPAILGLVAIRRERRREYLPLLTLLAVLLLYHPANFPTLRIFPWAAMSRVAGRSTLALPVLLSLVAIAIPLEALARKRRAFLLAAVILLSTIEIFCVYRQIGRNGIVAPSAELMNLVRAVREAPGAGVLDFPFCILSGNGIPEAICPYMKNVGEYGLQRFHEKKVVGLNFGRLTAGMAAPYFLSGWPYLADGRETERCFTDEGWRFFDDFLALGDFAGILLHRDLLPPSCGAEFSRRYGTAVAVARMPSSGSIEFYPRPSGAAARVDRAAVQRLRYAPELPVEVLDLREPPRSGVEVRSIGPEKGELLLFRGRGLVAFPLRVPKPVRVEGVVRSEYPGQVLKIVANGIALAEIGPLTAGEPRDFVASFTGVPGRNEITFDTSIHGTPLQAAWHYVTTRGKSFPRDRAASFSSLLIRIAR